MLRLVITVITLGWAAAAAAETAVLLIGNEDYSRLRDAGRADEIPGAAKVLERQGVRVVARRDADAPALDEALVEFERILGTSDTRMVALGGRFAHTSTETYFLGTETGIGTLSDVATNSIALSTVLAWLAETPGHAILFLAGYEPQTQGDGLLNEGIGDFEIPEGVTVLRGIPRHSASFIREYLAVPGREYIPATGIKGITIAGYAPRDHVFLEDRPVFSEERGDTLDFRLRDIIAWRAADADNTVDAYEAYIDAFPTGQFRAMAENRIQAMTDTPEARAERAEQALDLNREQRRDIQRDLSLLDYNTRGIDGIFGRGTRSAIASWQRAQGVDPTGFLTADQITRLDAQAERRAAELQAEAERRRQQQLQQDLAYWDETGAIGDEAGLRAYLSRFPDGQFSQTARAQLDEIERQNRRNATERDRQLWNEAALENTAQAYRDYLVLSPDGAFRSEAEARLRAFDANAGSGNAAALREEEALGLSAGTRRIVESRLSALGLEPGQVDGTFDADTRRAIRRYQAARNLETTGYLSEAVVVQLLADSVRDIFR